MNPAKAIEWTEEIGSWQARMNRDSKAWRFEVGSAGIDEMNNFGVQVEWSWNHRHEYEDCVAEKEHVV